jgi:hypothetical protein
LGSDFKPARRKPIDGVYRPIVCVVLLLASAGLVVAIELFIRAIGTSALTA